MKDEESFLEKRFNLTETWKFLLDQEAGYSNATPLSKTGQGGELFLQSQVEKGAQGEQIADRKLREFNHHLYQLHSQNLSASKNERFLDNNKLDTRFIDVLYEENGVNNNNAAFFAAIEQQERELLAIFLGDLAGDGSAFKVNDHHPIAPNCEFASESVEKSYIKREEKVRKEDSYLDFSSNNGLNYKKIRYMQSGRHNIEAFLDLHGYTLAEAEAIFNQFVLRNYNAKKRFLLIITGKGESKLHNYAHEAEKITIKTELQRWMNQILLRDKIIRCQQAHPMHGGKGAFYLLLKSH